MNEHYQFIFYVPESHLDEVKSAVFAAGAGRIGNYDCCCWQIEGQGQFRPQAGSDAYCGTEGQLHSLSEFRVEMVCSLDLKVVVLKALKEAHPYEEPAYSFIRIET